MHKKEHLPKTILESDDMVEAHAIHIVYIQENYLYIQETYLLFSRSHNIKKKLSTVCIQSNVYYLANVTTEFIYG